MTRVRMCAQRPGLIVRHHAFENFPRGTTPHTTALLDYLILATAVSLKPFTTHAIDLAGALVSPLFALFGAWFLCWWSRLMQLRYQWAMLILYGISPILVHGAELGRPDHQSLSILLVTVALCAEWTLRVGAGEASAGTVLRRWSIVSGFAWGLALWVSLYEPLLLLLIMIVVLLALEYFHGRHAENARWRHAVATLLGRDRRIGWFCFVAIVALAFLVERRIPSLPMFEPNDIFRNWARTIGELAHVSPLNPIWFCWAGWLLVALPFLIWLGFRKSKSAGKSEGLPIFMVALLVATYLFTIWQARWAYLFLLIFTMALPSLLEPIRWRFAVWALFILSTFPIFREWDVKLWPDGTELSRRTEYRREVVELRELALNLMSSEPHSFLSPWWLSPSIAYWSGQAGVTGSSHESLDGIAESARFYLAEDLRKPREILENRAVAWVFAYDSDRVGANSATVLGVPMPRNPLCRILDRAPAQAPPFLIFFAQNGTGKLFRVANNR